MNERVEVRQQKRKTMALKVTPAGLRVLIPSDLDPESDTVRTFISRALDKVSPPVAVPDGDGMPRAEILDLVREWADRLQVDVGRIQFQSMRNKWGSVSTGGNLTLATDLLDLPGGLVEYVVCHEILHLKVPSHNQLYRLLLSQHMPDWQERERELGRWAIRPKRKHQISS
jgi:predicted metal-dependent hydrolase